MDKSQVRLCTVWHCCRQLCFDSNGAVANKKTPWKDAPPKTNPAHKTTITNNKKPTKQISAWKTVLSNANIWHKTPPTEHQEQVVMHRVFVSYRNRVTCLLTGLSVLRLVWSPMETAQASLVLISATHKEGFRLALRESIFHSEQFMQKSGRWGSSCLKCRDVPTFLVSFHKQDWKWIKKSKWLCFQSLMSELLLEGEEKQK